MQDYLKSSWVVILLKKLWCIQRQITNIWVRLTIKKTSASLLLYSTSSNSSKISNSDPEIPWRTWPNRSQKKNVKWFPRELSQNKSSKSNTVNEKRRRQKRTMAVNYACMTHTFNKFTQGSILARNRFVQELNYNKGQIIQSIYI